MGSWTSVGIIGSTSFICGYCNHNVASNLGYRYTNGSLTLGYIRICPHCNKPVYFDLEKETVTPSPSYGDVIQKIPKNIIPIYDEARASFSIRSYTSCVMLCRKIIMNIAVDQGAKEDQSFKFYVDYLDENNFIGKNSKVWVEKIRLKGNEATHEIKSIDELEAKDIIDFTIMLLRIIYEFATV